jgi:adenylate kinase
MGKRESIILIGPPGSGKSSIANRLIEDEGITAVETGNLLRDEVEKETDIGKDIGHFMDAGKIVPSGIVKEVVLANLEEHDKELILFDGFPRVTDQINTFNEISETLNIKLKKVIILELDDKVIIKRLTGRRICKDCGKIYNIYFDPPDQEDKCKKCGGSLKLRSDDKPDIVKERIEYYKENTLPVADYFRKKNPDLIMVIDAGKSINDVTKEIKKII